MGVSVIDVVAAEQEVVAPVLQEIFESSDEIAGMFKKAAKDKLEISRYLARAPLQQFRGGNFHKYNADGGSLGIGTNMLITSLQFGYITTVRSYRCTDEQRDTTATSKQAIVKVFQKSLADAMTEAQIDDDISIHNDGTGKLTNSSSASASTTSITFAGSTDTLGINRLREGMTVEVWDTTGATLRSGYTGPVWITAIDYNAKTVTLNQAVSDMVSGDLLAIPGMTAYGPSTLTSFSSTWPGGGLTNGPGLTGDSFRHGIYYAQDSTGANYYCGKLKSTIPQLQPTHVTASNSGFTFAMALQGLDGIIQRRDASATKGLKGIAHMKQRQAVVQIGVNISYMLRGGKNERMPDLMPTNIGYTDDFDMAGIPCRVSKRQFNDRIDVLNPSLWGRAQTHDIRFKEIGGKKVFEVRNSDGTIAASSEYHIENAFDFVSYDPGLGFYIDGLAVPA